MNETWLVLGGSSTIARAFARAAAESGDDVILAGRDRADLAATAADVAIRSGRAAHVLDFDARDRVGHAALVGRAAELAGAGPLSVFLAAGVMSSQAEIDADPIVADETISVNFTGAVSVLQALAAVLEARGAGRIVALGSVAGDRGRPKNHVYGAAKAGLATYLQGLRARLHRAGVMVTTVKPGFVDTSMTWGLKGMFLVASPDAVARACLAAGRAGREVVYVPWFWRWIMVIIRAIPERLFKRLNV